MFVSRVFVNGSINTKSFFYSNEDTPYTNQLLVDKAGGRGAK